MRRYAFGPFVLEPEARVLRRDGEPIPLAGKTLDTLLVLVQNRGRIVEKDELLSRVWSGSIVEEANLTQSIFTVRKILGDSPKDHRYIATVAGRGYQFVAPVTEVPALEASRGAFWRERIYQVGAAGALLAILIGIGVLRSRDSARDDVALEQPVPFTSSPGFALYPAFSPDDRQIAYTWSRGGGSAGNIYVKQVGSETELRVTNSPGIDILPAWSPDGGHIAFYRRLSGHSGYYVISALGGPERQLIQVDFPAATESWPHRYFPEAAGIDWFPDGRHVALVLPTEWRQHQLIPPNAGDWDPRQIVRLDLETGEQVPITAPPPNLPFGDIEPSISPDGKLLAFVRAASDSIWLIGLTGKAKPQALTNPGVASSGIAWTADSRELIFAAWKDTGARLWRLPAKGGTARPITSSIEYVSSPAVARLGHRLAYAVSTGRESLWRIPIEGSPPFGSGLPEQLIQSTRSDTQPAYSRDGPKLAFASNRSGPEDIWASDADGKHAVELTNRHGSDNGTPRWSPDSSEIAFDTHADGKADIFVVSVEGHRIRRVTQGPEEDVTPNWSKDGHWIYFASNRNGDFQIYKASASRGESTSSPPVQITTGGGFYAEESADGKYLYFAKGRGKRGLWRRPLDSSAKAKEEPVLESLQHWGWWALGHNGVFFLESEAELPDAKVHLKFLDLMSRKVTDLRTLEYPVSKENAALAVSPDGHFATVEEFENSGSNIVLVENFR